MVSEFIETEVILSTAESNSVSLKGHIYLDSLLEENIIDEFKRNLNDNEYKGDEQLKHLFKIEYFDK